MYLILPRHMAWGLAIFRDCFLKSLATIRNVSETKATGWPYHLTWYRCFPNARQWHAGNNPGLRVSLEPTVLFSTQSPGNWKQNTGYRVLGVTFLIHKKMIMEFNPALGN